MHQCLGRFLVSPVDDAIKGLAGNAHALRCVLIVQALAVRQSHGFQFVGSKRDLLNLAQRNSRGLEIIRGRAVFDSSGTGRPRHAQHYITGRQRFERKSDLICNHGHVLGLCPICKQYPARPRIKSGSPSPCKVRHSPRTLAEPRTSASLMPTASPTTSSVKRRCRLPNTYRGPFLHGLPSKACSPS